MCTALPPADPVQLSGIYNPLGFPSTKAPYGIYAFTDKPGTIQNVRLEQINLVQKENTPSGYCNLRPCLEAHVPQQPLKMRSIENAENLSMRSVRCLEASAGHINIAES